MPKYAFRSDYASVFQGIDFTNQLIITTDEVLANQIRNNPYFRNGTIQEIKDIDDEEKEPENAPVQTKEDILAKIAKLEEEKPKTWQMQVSKLKKKLETME